ncbi:MAG TPA: hypothetical protein PLL06_16380, partial [Acidobacteriota bacterium]|nr:hypothetical protein [Acidobacteriota bacterium]
ELVERIDSTKQELNERIDGVRVELVERIDSTKQELNERIDEVHTDLSDQIAETRKDLKADNQLVFAAVRDVNRSHKDTRRRAVKADADAATALQQTEIFEQRIELLEDRVQRLEQQSSQH